jgi:hypothetical protein
MLGSVQMIYPSMIRNRINCWDGNILFFERLECLNRVVYIDMFIFAALFIFIVNMGRDNNNNSNNNNNNHSSLLSLWNLKIMKDTLGLSSRLRMLPYTVTFAYPFGSSRGLYACFQPLLTKAGLSRNWNALPTANKGKHANQDQTPV